MEIIEKEVIVTKTMFYDRDFNFEHEYYDLIAVIDELDGNIRITHKGLADYLIEKGVVTWDGFWKKHDTTDKFEEFYDQVYKLEV